MLIDLQSKETVLNFGCWSDVKDLGEFTGGKTIIRIYFIENKSIFDEIKFKKSIKFTKLNLKLRNY